MVVSSELAGDGTFGKTVIGIYSEPIRPEDGDNPVNFVVSDGTPKGIWKGFEKRFNITIHEWYATWKGDLPTTRQAGVASGPSPNLLMV